MRELPPELLSQVLALAYPTLDDSIVDFEYERHRKIDLLSAMLVSKRWNAVARPFHDSFVAFGSPEDVEAYMERADAGEIDAAAVRDMTLRPVFATQIIAEEIEELEVIAASQTTAMLHLDHATGPIWAAIYSQGRVLRSEAETTWIASWEESARRLMSTLPALQRLRFTELEPFLNSRAVSQCTHCVIETIEWESACADPAREDSDLEGMWTSVWNFLDSQPQLAVIHLRQHHRLRWEPECMPPVAVKLASRISYLSLGGEIGKHVLQSNCFARIAMPSLRELRINDIYIDPSRPGFKHLFNPPTGSSWILPSLRVQMRFCLDDDKAVQLDSLGKLLVMAHDKTRNLTMDCRWDVDDAEATQRVCFSVLIAELRHSVSQLAGPTQLRHLRLVGSPQVDVDDTSLRRECDRRGIALTIG